MTPDELADCFIVRNAAGEVIGEAAELANQFAAADFLTRCQLAGVITAGGVHQSNALEVMQRLSLDDAFMFAAIEVFTRRDLDETYFPSVPSTAQKLKKIVCGLERLGESHGGQAVERILIATQSLDHLDRPPAMLGERMAFLQLIRTAGGILLLTDDLQRFGWEGPPTWSAVFHNVTDENLRLLLNGRSDRHSLEVFTAESSGEDATASTSARITGMTAAEIGEIERLTGLSLNWEHDPPEHEEAGHWCVGSVATATPITTAINAVNDAAFMLRRKLSDRGGLQHLQDAVDGGSVAEVANAVIFELRNLMRSAQV